MTAENEARRLIELFGLAPHPEGGFFRETYRSGESVPAGGLPERFGAARSLSTAIYYLLRSGEKSHLHRIKSDELWHFYLGDPLELVQIAPEGGLERIVLGRDVEDGQRVQHRVPAGHWFGALPAPGSRFCFVGCTVAPGFDFADFELAGRARSIERFPAARADIERLTKAGT